MVLSRQPGHPFTCRESGPGLASSPPLPLTFQVGRARNSATMPGRSCSGMRRVSTDAPPCVTSVLAVRLPSTVEWRQGERLRLRRYSAAFCVKTRRLCLALLSAVLGVCFCPERCRQTVGRGSRAPRLQLPWLPLLLGSNFS